MKTGQVLDECVRESMRFLTQEYGFVQGDSISDGQSFQVEFRSDVVCLKIEKYRREVYAYLYKPAKQNDEINLFVLIQFLHKETTTGTKSNYFTEVEDLAENFRLQTQWIAKALKANFREINSFFLSPEFEQNTRALNQYVIGKNPELFRKQVAKGRASK